MNEQQREKVALFRFSVIGPLASAELAYGELQRLMRELSQHHYSIPFSNRSRISAATIEEWLYAYRRNGFEALKPKVRSDKGASRAIRKELADALLAAKKEHPRRGLKATLKYLLTQGVMKPNELPLSNGYRFLSKHLPPRPASKTGNEKLRFSHRYPNDCWQSDSMHGPYLTLDGSPKARKVYLIAFLDDATRLIVGARFFFAETAANIKSLLRHAVLTYGIPRKLYLDNGRNFCSHDIQIACATMRTALIHTTPYYPEGKGKIERFFGTVRSGFLSALPRVNSLDQLNAAFHTWMHNDYNRSSHSALNGDTPLDTFLRSAENHIRRLPSHIDPAELFCAKECRLVARDGTFRINNILYEAQEHLIGLKIDVLFDKDDPTHLVKVYDGNVFVHKATPIDYNANAQAKRKPLQ